jgi:gamma-glutamyltranspeptidase/glutathione hydrolase
MRDFQLPGRSPVYATRAMAATSHPRATLVAVDVLRAGGNAMDAAVAAAAYLGVVEPQSTGIGGDCFALYAPGGGDRVIAFNGSGRAPRAAEPGWYAEQGIETVDPDGPHAVTVPGAVDAWARLLADHGSKGLDELLQPAIAAAEEGFPVQPRIATDWANNIERLSRDPAATRILLPDGRPPAVGDIHRNPELAETLRTIAAEGRDGFYTGRVAEDMVAYLKGVGGLHELDDFARAEGEYVDPIKTDYRGYEIYECPPNGQGIVVLMMLNMIQGFPLAELDPLGPERFHLAIEAGRLAYRDRDLAIADPAQAEVPVETLLSADYAAEQRAAIDPERALADLPPSPFPDHGNTVYISVVDADRNAVSFINSVFDDFGSALVSPTTGVVLHSRGSSFRLTPGHPNCIGPDKRPLHTIIPGMALKGGRTVMPFGVMGAHYQPFGHVHFLMNLIDYGLDVQEALDMARLFPRAGRVPSRLDRLGARHPGGRLGPAQGRLRPGVLETRAISGAHPLAAVASTSTRISGLASAEITSRVDAGLARPRCLSRTPR